VSEAPFVQSYRLTGGIPYGRLFAAVSLAVLALQIAALIVAVVRWRRVRRQAGESVPSLRLPGIAGAALIPLIAAGAGTIHAARNIVMDAFALSRAPWDAGYGITVQVPAFPAVVTAWLAAGLLWIAAFWLTLDARRRARGGDAPPLAPIVALGLLPTVIGVWRWKAIWLHGFDAAADLPPGAHSAAVLLAADTAGDRLATFARFSSWTIIVLAIGALAVLVRAHRRSGDPGASGEGARALRRSILISASALAGAAILFLAARPMRAENRLPWPPNHDSDLAWMEHTAPDLHGPDEIERAPVVHVFPPASNRPPLCEIWLDSHVVAPDSLVDKLWVLRDEFRRRHPDTKFDGTAVAVISREAPYGEIVSVLRAMHDAGFPHPQFAFTRSEAYDRPTLRGFGAGAGGSGGSLKRLRVTAVRVTLVDDMDKEYAEDAQAGVRGALVRLSEFDTYDALTRKLVDLRRAGQAVILDLEALK
jgi:hypothetical protein